MGILHFVSHDLPYAAQAASLFCQDHLQFQDQSPEISQILPATP